MSRNEHGPEVIPHAARGQFEKNILVENRKEYAKKEVWKVSTGSQNCGDSFAFRNPLQGD